MSAENLTSLQEILAHALKAEDCPLKTKLRLDAKIDRAAFAIVCERSMTELKA